jgi:hypothetical protein
MIRLFIFVGGTPGGWRIISTVTPRRAAVRSARARWRCRILRDIREPVAPARHPKRGYVSLVEKKRLATAQAPLGRLPAAQATLIAICKTAGWWAPAQNERRRIFA